MTPRALPGKSPASLPYEPEVLLNDVTGNTLPLASISHQFDVEHVTNNTITFCKTQKTRVEQETFSRQTDERCTMFRRTMVGLSVEDVEKRRLPSKHYVS